MSKEQAYASNCIGCGRPITFFEQHVPHCAEARAALAKQEGGKGKRGKKGQKGQPGRRR